MRKFVLLLLIAVTAPRAAYADDVSAVRLLVGRSIVVDVGSAIARVSLTSADVADAVVTSANQLLVNGKTPGTISMYVWERSGGLHRYEVVVQRDLARLNEQMKRLFPGESIDAQSSGKGIVLSGLVSNKETFDKAFVVAGGYVDKADEVVNMLRIQESTASNQVLLRVRFAEVSRSAITDLGASLFTGPNGYKDVLARSTTSTVAPVFDNSDPTREKLVFSDFLNLFLFDAKHQLGTVIKALQTKGQFQSLAEPNLVAESGKEASFLAGGEFPVPIAQGGQSNAISVVYKEFGVRLNFTPVIHGDRVHLKVRPEVSTLDFANGVMLQGFRIPALSTRRTETEVDLMDGQTFAIAGLINNSMNSTLQKIPGIGDIPILGLLFKSKAASKEQTELVVMITPQILDEQRANRAGRDDHATDSRSVVVRRDANAAEHARAIPAADPREEADRAAAARVHPGPRRDRSRDGRRGSARAIARAGGDAVRRAVAGVRRRHPESAASAGCSRRAEHRSAAGDRHRRARRPGGAPAHRKRAAHVRSIEQTGRGGQAAEREAVEETGRGEQQAGEGAAGTAGQSRAGAGQERRRVREGRGRRSEAPGQEGCRGRQDRQRAGEADG